MIEGLDPLSGGMDGGGDNDFEIIGPLDVAIRALQDIADPIHALIRDAKAEGNQIDGRYAADLSNYAPYLKDIARKALIDLGANNAEIRAGQDEADAEKREDHNRRAME